VWSGQSSLAYPIDNCDGRILYLSLSRAEEDLGRIPTDLDQGFGLSAEFPCTMFHYGIPPVDNCDGRILYLSLSRAEEDLGRIPTDLDQGFGLSAEFPCTMFHYGIPPVSVEEAEAEGWLPHI
jgi:hypothetical protein